jgi:hypothetical protein
MTSTFGNQLYFISMVRYINPHLLRLRKYAQLPILCHKTVAFRHFSLELQPKTKLYLARCIGRGRDCPGCLIDYALKV